MFQNRERKGNDMGAKHIESWDDERASGSGIIVTLRYGYSFDTTHDAVMSFDTVREARESTRRKNIFACDCAECVTNQGETEMTKIGNTEYTDNEIAMLRAFYSTSMEICGACDEDENLSYMNADDLLKVLGGTKQSIGGTMSSLEQKMAITDTRESSRGAKTNDWIINDEAAEFFNAEQ